VKARVCYYCLDGLIPGIVDGGPYRIRTYDLGIKSLSKGVFLYLPLPSFQFLLGALRPQFEAIC